MPVIIIPAVRFYEAGTGGDAEGHSHTNFNTLNKLSTDTEGNLCFNGKIVGEKAVETACNITLTDAQIRQKFIALPHDCDTSRVITLSLNGVAMPQGDFWEVRENVNSSTSDLIVWNGLALDTIIRAGDKIFISYYKIV